MTKFNEATHPESKYWRYTSLRLDAAAFLLGEEDPEGEHSGKHYSELPGHVREWVDVLNNAIRGGVLKAKKVYVTRAQTKEQIGHEELGRSEYADWETELTVSELKKWCDANGHKHPWITGPQGEDATSKPPKLRSDREESLLRVIAALWEFSGLPIEHYAAADKLSAAMGSWGWEKPLEETIAKVLLEAKNLPRIRN